MEYFEKLAQNPYEDLMWNLPEQKQGEANVIGGNAQSFLTEIKTAEFLANKYPVKTVELVLPDALKNKLPELPNLTFVKSTSSGTFADGAELAECLGKADFNLVLGDLSKNSATTQAIASACQSAEKMTLITRDTVDAIADNEPDKLLMNEHIILLASMPQLQKIFRAVYYPKMLLLTQPLIQVAEALHKFTLSYPVAIVTLSNDQILVANAGTVKAMELAKSDYTPMTIWSGELAAKIVALNLYNPNDFIKATTCAIFA